jgi:hypothetical protein
VPPRGARVAASCSFGLGKTEQLDALRCRRWAAIWSRISIASARRRRDAVETLSARR